MASIRRRKGTRLFTACITLPDGTARQFATGLDDEKEALAVAVEAENAARRFHVKPHQLRASLTRIAADVLGQQDTDPAPWLRAWAESRAGGVEPKTAAAYAKAADYAGTWLSRENIRSLESITHRDIERLRDELAARHSGSTANHKVKILRMAFKTAIRDRLMTHNPAVGVAPVRTSRTVRREFRPAEIEILLPALTGEWRALFFMGLFTGQRLNDLAELRWSQIDLSRATLAFFSQKTDATVALPLVPQIIDSLAELESSDDPAAPVFARLHGLTRPARSNAFRAILAPLGLARPITHWNGPRRERGTRRQTSELSFHSLRHTATTMLKAAGVADSIARAIIGHESAAVSRVYTHLDMETMRQALHKIASVDPD